MEAGFGRGSKTAILALALIGAGITFSAHASSTPTPQCTDWTAYRTFAARFVQADGRVIDYSTPTQQTTSEGQSYAMFFALVANDRSTFDRLLAWTRTNLAANQFEPGNVRLP
ncbi:glycosyl hydrolase family 8, partial [Caballeronia mineralivorans]